MRHKCLCCYSQVKSIVFCLMYTLNANRWCFFLFCSCFLMAFTESIQFHLNYCKRARSMEIVINCKLNHHREYRHFDIEYGLHDWFSGSHQAHAADRSFRIHFCPCSTTRENPNHLFSLWTLKGISHKMRVFCKQSYFM